MQTKKFCCVLVGHALKEAYPCLVSSRSLPADRVEVGPQLLEEAAEIRFLIPFLRL